MKEKGSNAKKEGSLHCRDRTKAGVGGKFLVPQKEKDRHEGKRDTCLYS